MHSEPWFREHDGSWYFYKREGGKRRQIKLVQGEENKQAAIDRWHKLCSAPSQQPVVTSTSAVALIDQYLDWCQRGFASKPLAAPQAVGKALAMRHSRL